MKRIVKRKHAKEQFTGSSDNATHLIKMGVKVRKYSERTRKEVDFPSPVNGFFVALNTRDANGIVIPAQGKNEGSAVLSAPVDYKLMQDLGYTQQQIDQALALGRKAPVGMLPQSLEFALLNDAVLTEDGGWDLGQILNEEYRAFKPKLTREDRAIWGRDNAPGLFCHGNGDVATRREPDGTTRQIACNPFGKAGVAACDFCPYSQASASPCKATMHLIVMLARRDENGQLVPLANMHHARFRFATLSENNAMRIIDELEKAATLLGGWISGLSGTLTFSQQFMLRPDSVEGEGSNGLVPQVFFQLNKWEIEQRLREMREAKIPTLTTAPAPRLIATTAPMDTPQATVKESVTVHPARTVEDDFAETDREHYEGDVMPDDDDAPWEQVDPAAPAFSPEDVGRHRAMAVELWSLADAKASTIPGSSAASWFEFWTRVDGKKGVPTIDALFSQEGKDAERHARAMGILEAALEKARAAMAKTEVVA